MMAAPSTELDYLEGRLTLLASEAGGRKGPIRTRYMPNWWLPGLEERTLASAAIELVDVEELAPGGTASIKIYPFVPEMWEQIRIGANLEVTEGGHFTVGAVVVTKEMHAKVPVG